MQMNMQARAGKTGRPRLVAIAASVVVSAGLMLSASSAFAHDSVRWSIGIGVNAPPVVYQQPTYRPPAYYQQPGVIYTQPPVVYGPAPVVVYRGSYNTARRDHEWQEHKWRQHEWREHEWREHEWDRRHDWHGHHHDSDRDRD